MKKEYIKPEMEITEFEVDDVIDGSNPELIEDGDEDDDL